MRELKSLFDISMGSVVSVSRAKSISLNPFAFVVNVAGLTGSSTVAVAPGHALRQASNEEIKFIKDFVGGLFGKHFGPGLWENAPPAAGKGQFQHLPAEEWRYFVIEFNADDENPDLLEESLAIAPHSLDIGFTLLKAMSGNHEFGACLYRPPRVFQSLSALADVVNSQQSVGSFTEAEGQQSTEVYESLRAHNHGIFDLRKVIKLLMELKDLPSFSPLQILGYFAILETILTHQPQPEDRYDSITRQIVQKLALLNRRWQPALDYTSFGSTPHHTIWSKMYSYRSAIAHGATPDFKSQLSVLGTANQANVLIRDVVTKTIRQVLIEPQLLADLHNC
jgi:hypothetical protein